MTNFEKFNAPLDRVDAFWAEHTEPTEAHSVGGWVEIFSNWLGKEAHAEEALSCPFCGSKVEIDELNSVVNCTNCNYMGGNIDGEDFVTSHNSVAKAMMGGAK